MQIAVTGFKGHAHIVYTKVFTAAYGNESASWIGLHALYDWSATRCRKQIQFLVHFYVFHLVIAAAAAVLKCVYGKTSGRWKTKGTHSPGSLGLHLPSIITLGHK